jgi:tRNA (guanine-N(7)-)-methyltransferase subunit TRM82
VPVASTDDAAPEGDERPAKKQKTTAKAAPALTNIIKLTVSNDQQHAVAVTEDKCVRVYSIQTDGGIVELSQRTMPKRPCALEVLPDNDTIICGDKFGDVYSLPLLPTDESEKEAADLKAAQAAQDAKNAELRAQGLFQPSATNLTVHTQRNLRSLESQQKQKLFTPRKEVLAFEHKLLLGHVSMLTDATFAVREIEGKSRGYIITADRDEHIRISRAAPQSHIVEGFCLGHTEFVSKICLIPGSDLLVSGGGDEWIGVWDWLNSKLTSSINIKQHLGKFLAATPEDKDPQIAVSGMWIVPIQNQPGNHAVVVASEKVPALLVISSSTIGDSQTHVTVVDQQLQGLNPLDVTVIDQRVLVSLDARDDGQKRIVALQLAANDTGSIDVSRDEESESTLTQLNDLIGIEEDPKSLESLLYGIKNLKKRTGWEEREEKE